AKLTPIIRAQATMSASNARPKWNPPIAAAAPEPARTGAKAFAQVCGRAPSSQFLALDIASIVARCLESCFTGAVTKRAAAEKNRSQAAKKVTLLTPQPKTVLPASDQVVGGLLCMGIYPFGSSCLCPYAFVKRKEPSHVSCRCYRIPLSHYSFDRHEFCGFRLRHL